DAHRDLPSFPTRRSSDLMLAIARALMTNPALLLLDEPLEGLAPIIVEELVAAIRKMIADEGTAFILIEQHAEVALSLTADAIVLERGSIGARARSARAWRRPEPVAGVVAADALRGARSPKLVRSSAIPPFDFRYWRNYFL